jgi:hypothetical protein
VSQVRSEVQVGRAGRHDRVERRRLEGGAISSSPRRDRRRVEHEVADPDAHRGLSPSAVENTP